MLTLKRNFKTIRHFQEEGTKGGHRKIVEKANCVIFEFEHLVTNLYRARELNFLNLGLPFEG